MFFLKPYAKQIFLLILSVSVFSFLIIFYNKKTSMYVENIEKIQKAHDEEIKKIKQSFDEERKQHELNITKLQSDLEEAKSRHEQETVNLEKKKSDSVKKNLNTYDNDPMGMAIKISQTTGFKVVP